MKLIKYIAVIVLPLMLVMTGCKLSAPSETKSTASLGNADFSVYVSIGNSLTAGYQSGSLVEEHQMFSYPYMIAKQAGVKSFEQPLISYPGLTPILELKLLDPPTIEPATGQGAPTNTALARPYNNLGVPGALLPDILLTTSSANSLSPGNVYFDVILRNPSFAPDTTILQQALSLSPTFITCWIGNNDVLGYATSGGTLPTTPTATFDALYQQLLGGLSLSGAGIVVANLPDITAIPFFTTIPYLVEVPDVGLVPLQISTASGTKTATANDLILLTAKSLIGDTTGTYGPPGVPVGLHPLAPLPTTVVLDSAEVAVAKATVADFNTSIQNAADALGIAVLDVNAAFNDIAKNGVSVGGQEFSADFITGGLFSLDGVHPSDVGYAVVANLFIDKINEKFNAGIPHVNVLEIAGRTSIPTEIDAAMTQEAAQRAVEIFTQR